MIEVMISQVARFGPFRQEPSPLIEIDADGERFGFSRFVNRQACQKGPAHLERR